MIKDKIATVSISRICEYMHYVRRTDSEEAFQSFMIEPISQLAQITQLFSQYLFTSTV
jgi:hypothetical protein